MQKISLWMTRIAPVVLLVLLIFVVLTLLLLLSLTLLVYNALCEHIVALCLLVVGVELERLTEGVECRLV